jgi:hypothetical protein
MVSANPRVCLDCGSRDGETDFPRRRKPDAPPLCLDCIAERARVAGLGQEITERKAELHRFLSVGMRKPGDQGRLF